MRLLGDLGTSRFSRDVLLPCESIDVVVDPDRSHSPGDRMGDVAQQTDSTDLGR